MPFKFLRRRVQNTSASPIVDGEAAAILDALRNRPFFATEASGEMLVSPAGGPSEDAKNPDGTSVGQPDDQPEDVVTETRSIQQADDAFVAVAEAVAEAVAVADAQAGAESLAGPQILAFVADVEGTQEVETPAETEVTAEQHANVQDEVGIFIETYRHKLLTSFDDIDHFASEKSRRLKIKFAAIPEESRASAWAQSWRQVLIRMVELDLLCEFATRAGSETVAEFADAARLMKKLAASGRDGS